MHSCFAAAHLHGVTKPTLCFPGSGFARWERAVLAMTAFAGAGRGQQAPQCVVQGSSHVPHLGMILGGRVMVVAGLGPRGDSKNVFLIFFGFSAQALTVGTADETPRQKPYPQTTPSWSRAVPRTLCLQTLPVWSGVSSASGFAAAESPTFSPCHQEVTFFKPLRCCWPWRPRRGFLERFPGRVAVHYSGALRAGPSVSTLLSQHYPPRQETTSSVEWGGNAPQQTLCISWESLVLPRGEVSAQHPKSRWEKTLR